MYEKIKDLVIHPPRIGYAKIVGVPAEDIINDCIKIQKTKGHCFTEALDFVIPELGNIVYWIDPVDLIVEFIKQGDY